MVYNLLPVQTEDSPDMQCPVCGEEEGMIGPEICRNCGGSGRVPSVSASRYCSGDRHMFVFAGGELPEGWPCDCGQTNYSPQVETDDVYQRCIDISRKVGDMEIRDLIAVVNMVLNKHDWSIRPVLRLADLTRVNDAYSAAASVSDPEGAKQSAAGDRPTGSPQERDGEAGTPSRWKDDPRTIADVKPFPIDP